MRNKIHSILSFVCFLVLLNACKDEPTDKTKDSIITDACAIKEFVTATYKIAFEYDNQDRITKQKFMTLGDSIIDFQAFDYSTSGKVLVVKNSELYTCEIILNAKGDAKSKKEIYFVRPNHLEIDIVQETEYTYNTDGYLISEKLTTTEGSNITIYTYEYNWVDGNLASQKNINSKGLTEVTFNYTYYSNLPNYNGTLDRKYALNGLKSKNMAKTRDEIRPSTAPKVTNYTYTKNSKGNLATMTASVIGLPDEVSTINWTCK